MTSQRKAGRNASQGRDRSLRVFLLGATGTIGRAVAERLVSQNHEVVAFVRAGRRGAPLNLPAGVQIRFGEVGDVASVGREGFAAERFDAVVSCMASRTGVAEDAWAIDHRANLNVLTAAKACGVDRMVLLSALCVQKPRLAFQHAKLAFETELKRSGLIWSIVRPTAFFKSLSGQVDRVRSGKPYLLFGDGRLTACKPISDRDLATYIVDCLPDPSRWNRILPIGGPGPAQTPREQAEALFEVLGRAPRFAHVPPALLDVVAGGLALAGAVAPPLRTKAELARIGRYYATESMLVLNPETGRYDAEATPEFGQDLLIDYQERLLRGETTLERGDQAVF